MSLWQTFRLALRALARNKVRSFLTTLGIVIGVAAVIAMVAVGEGAKERVQSVFSSMGANLFIVVSGTTTRGGAFGGFGSMPTLTWDDLLAIQREAPAMRTAAALLRTTAQVQSEEQNWTTGIQGTSQEYFDIRDWRPSRGLLLSASDIEGATKVAVLGQTVVDKLFGPQADAVGEHIRIKGVPFQVIGVLEKKGQSAMGQDNDDAVFIPQTTFQTRIQSGGLSRTIQGAIFVSAVSRDATDRAISQVSGILRDRHHIRQGADDDFSIRNLTEMAGAMQDSTRTFTSLLAAVAAVSLVVGGIGIMNIMLVSVTERTREIGVRMAVGARPRDILAQFLVEALALASVGGLVGIILGLSVAAWFAAALGWPMLIRPIVVLIAVGFSGLIGVAFGLYPANRAARLDPIDALRYE